jgi:hypothetical protein
MRMCMPHRLVPVPARMRLGHAPRMLVPVVLVVDVDVLVFQRLALCRNRSQVR